MVNQRLAVTLLSCVVALTMLASAFAQSNGRLVEGTVFYERGEPAKDAAVQLKNPTTLQVVSALTDGQGHYHFAGLDPDRDYEVRAVKNGRRSGVHNVSRFSSKKVETVDLYLKEKSDER